MNDSNIRTELRTELCTTLQALAEVVPEMRMGQLMAAIGELCIDLHGRGLWEAEDTELLEAAWQYRRNFEAAMVTAEGNGPTSRST
jgi:hypothetical protein